MVRSEGGELVRRQAERTDLAALPPSQVSLLSHMLAFPYNHSLPVLLEPAAHRNF